MKIKQTEERLDAQEHRRRDLRSVGGKMMCRPCVGRRTEDIKLGRMKLKLWTGDMKHFAGDSLSEASGIDAADRKNNII